MAIQHIKPGARLGEDDPLCNVKSEKTLLNHDYNWREGFKTPAMQALENTRFELLSHCKDKDPNRGQQDDGVTSEQWPVQDSALRPQHGGPVVSTKEHK